MIQIHIHNAADVVKSRKGRFVAKIIDLMGASDRVVDRVVADQIQAALTEQGIDADIATTRSNGPFEHR